MNLSELLAAIKVPARQRQAFEDPLTGLPSRRALEQFLEHLIGRGEHFCLLMVDLDNFKSVNDTLGHCAGDEVLRRVVARLREALRPEALLCRWGGDEFLVVAPGISRSAARGLAARLVQAAELQVDQNLAIGASVGLASFPGEADSLQKLLAAADRAMYSVKQLGKSGWVEAGGELPRRVRLNRDVFVGRDAELKLLRRGLSDPASVGRMIVIQGGGGSGKTTLAGRALTEAGPLTLLQMRCSRETAQVPYAPLAAALRSRPLPSEPLDSLAEPFQRALARLMPNRLAQYLDRPAPTEKQIVFEAFVELIRRWSGDVPLVLFADDIQWMDRETRELLFYLHNFGELEHTLLLLTLRVEENDAGMETLLADLARRGRIAIVELATFSRPEMAQLIERALHAVEVPRELLTDAQRLSGGNPFLAVELLAEMVRAGNITWDNGLRYSPFRLDGALDIRLRLFLEHKLQLLNEELTAVLRAAAVIGNEFDSATLEQLTTLPAPRLQQALEQARQLNLLGEAGADGRRSFVNDLYREMVYQRCPADQRRTLHALLVELLSGRADPALVAFHAQQAGLTATAVDALIEAGDQALRRGICEAARSFSERAVELFERLPQGERHVERELRLLGCRCAAAWSVADFETRRNSALRMAGLLENLGRKEEALLQRNMAAAALRLMERWEESAAEYALLAAGAAGEDRGRLLINMADSLCRTGRTAEARRELNSARILLRGKPDYQASLDHKETLINAIDRRYDEAVRLARRAVSKDDTVDTWWYQHDLGEMLLHAGRLPQAVRAFVAGLERARSMPSLWGQACCLAGRILAEINLLRLESATQMRDELLKITQRTSEPMLHSISDALGARLYLAQGDLARAASALDDFDDPGSMEKCYFSGLLAALNHDQAAALHHAEQAIARAGPRLSYLQDSSGILLSEDDLYLLRCSMLLRLGREDCRSEVTRIAERSPFHAPGARAFGVLAELALNEGDEARGRDLYLAGLRRPGGRWQHLEHWDLIRERAARLPRYLTATRSFAARHNLAF